MIWLILIALVVWAFVWWLKNCKTVKNGSMVCVTGGVKSGKSTFSFWLAYRAYKRNVRSVKFRNWLRKVFKIKGADEELPLFYTTIPVAVPHVLLTTELAMRLERFAYKSVIWIDEASLFADSQNYKNPVVNKQLTLLNKLIAHETKGGTIVYNTQSIGDLHYSVRRCLSEIYYVHSTFKWLPFFLMCSVREERYVEDNIAVNAPEDLEVYLKRVVMPKTIWKKFDCYCYSKLTDDLPVNKNVTEAKSLKADKIVTLDTSIKVECDLNEKKECEVVI